MKSSFFSDPYIQSLSLKQRYIYLYYLFNEHVNWIGCYEISDKTAVFELDIGISIDDLQKEKKFFEEANKLCFVDYYVIIKNSEKHDMFLENIQLLKTALSQFQELPENVKSRFLSFKKNETIEHYKIAFKRLGYEMSSSLQPAYLVGYGVDEGIRDKGKGIRDKGYITPKKSKKIKAENNSKNLFEEFWNLYPEKKSKAKAEKTYKDLYKKHDEIMKGLRIYIAHHEFLEKKQKIDPRVFVPQWKHPTTWLNQECWNDEYSKEFQKIQDKIISEENEKVFEVKEKRRKEAESKYAAYRAQYFNKTIGDGKWTYYKPFNQKYYDENKIYISEKPELLGQAAKGFESEYPEDFEILKEFGVLIENE